MAVLEGNPTYSPNLDTASVAADRQRILKISHYNHRDTDAREHKT